MFHISEASCRLSIRQPSDAGATRGALAAGLLLQAIGLGWLALVASPTVPYLDLVPAFVVSGAGMSLFFAPVANVVLSSVRRTEEGIASGANNAMERRAGAVPIPAVNPAEAYELPVAGHLTLAFRRPASRGHGGRARRFSARGAAARRPHQVHPF